jgi:hypothetical protein
MPTFLFAVLSVWSFSTRIDTIPTDWRTFSRLYSHGVLSFFLNFLNANQMCPSPMKSSGGNLEFWNVPETRLLPGEEAAAWNPSKILKEERLFFALLCKDLVRERLWLMTFPFAEKSLKVYLLGSTEWEREREREREICAFEMKFSIYKWSSMSWVLWGCCWATSLLVLNLIHMPRFWLVVQVSFFPPPPSISYAVEYY